MRRSRSASTARILAFFAPRPRRSGRPSAKIEGIKNPKVEQQDEQQAIDIEVDLEKARTYGLKPGDVRRAASALIGGITVGSLFQEQKVFDVVVWGRPDIRKNLDDVQNLLIDTESGAQVRLADVARVEHRGRAKRDPSRRRFAADRRRGRGQRTLTGRRDRRGQERIKEGAFPFEYHAEVLGEHVERQAALASLYSYLIAAAIGIVLLLQAALGSWRLAGLVIVGMPVAALGGFLAAYLAAGCFRLARSSGLAAVLGLACAT